MWKYLFTEHIKKIFVYEWTSRDWLIELLPFLSAVLFSSSLLFILILSYWSKENKKKPLTSTAGEIECVQSNCKYEIWSALITIYFNIHLHIEGLLIRLISKR